MGGLNCVDLPGRAFLIVVEGFLVLTRDTRGSCTLVVMNSVLKRVKSAMEDTATDVGTC